MRRRKTLKTKPTKQTKEKKKLPPQATDLKIKNNDGVEAKVV